MQGQVDLRATSYKEWSEEMAAGDRQERTSSACNTLDEGTCHEKRHVKDES